MTGRDFILYILENHLEDEDMFKDGKLLGFVPAVKFAEKYNVGKETIEIWVMLGYLDGLFIYDKLFIPYNAKIKEGSKISYEG